MKKGSTALVSATNEGHSWVFSLLKEQVLYLHYCRTRLCILDQSWYSTSVLFLWLALVFLNKTNSPNCKLLLIGYLCWSQVMANSPLLPAQAPLSRGTSSGNIHKCCTQGIKREKKFHFNSSSYLKLTFSPHTHTWFPFLFNFFPTDSFKYSTNKIEIWSFTDPV